MDKNEFRALLFPLNETERYYRDHPEEAGSWTHNVSHDQDDIFMIRIQPSRNKMQSAMHGSILLGRTNGTPYQYITFNKQTRFSKVPLHRHDYIELFYIYAGHCTATINGRRVALQAGDVCIMDTRAIHAIDPAGEEDIILNCMIHQKYFNAQFIGRLASSGLVAQFLAEVLNEHSTHDNYMLFHSAGEPIIKELFEDAFCEYLDPGVCSADVLDSYMTLIFIQLARCYKANKEEEYRAGSRSYLTEVLHYIEENSATCTLEGTAAQFGYHPNYLSRAIKKATGFSFKELVNMTRLTQAAFLLKNTADPVSKIAADCGWSNQSQFYKKFSDGFGCTPRQYRETKGGD